MTQPLPEPLIGQIVEVTKGRETGQYAIVVGILSERFVLLADGSKRKFDQPKKKNIQHIRFTGEFAMEVYTSIQQSGRVTNSKLRYCLNRFASQLHPEHVRSKGEFTDGER
ncbi:KOW domain-containing RNA-binding protein [Effusibacillus pohliae]|uniref:KOW domain-containing RNA-binding protein n=1 Tax=Effusibacillus pohliae TaxID=232270 RepID=UPI000380C961|nr:KOW domain-containing RNA-binding protein [Effusibacillus pohliae]